MYHPCFDRKDRFQINFPYLTESLPHWTVLEKVTATWMPHGAVRKQWPAGKSAAVGPRAHGVFSQPPGRPLPGSLENTVKIRTGVRVAGDGAGGGGRPSHRTEEDAEGWVPSLGQGHTETLPGLRPRPKAGSAELLLGTWTAHPSPASTGSCPPPEPRWPRAVHTHLPPERPPDLRPGEKHLKITQSCPAPAHPSERREGVKVTSPKPGMEREEVGRRASAPPQPWLTARS